MSFSKVIEDRVGIHYSGSYSDRNMTKYNILKQVNSLKHLKYIREYYFPCSIFILSGKWKL